MKHSNLLKISLGFIIVISLAACGGEKKKDKSAIDTTSSELNKPKKETPKKTFNVSTVAKEIAKKDTGKTDKIFFIVKNVTIPPIDRSGYSVTKPENNEKYIAVQVWVKNISKSEITLSQDDFKLFDQDDAEYIEKTSFTEHRKEPIFFKTSKLDNLKMKPGEIKSGWITFTTNIKSKAIKFTHKNITVKL